jgi:Flp pilus assembly protein TadB
MVARLLLGMVALAAVVSVAMAAAYQYWDRQAEREHEREMKRLEQRDALVETAETNPGPEDARTTDSGRDDG